MLFHLLAQAATQTTQEVVKQAVDTETGKWYAPLIGALIAAGVALIAGLGGLVMAWVNAAKAKAAVVEAKARAEVLAAEAKARADAAAAASLVNSDRITTTARAVNDLQKTLTQVALNTPVPAPEQTATNPPKPLTGLVATSPTDHVKGT